MTIFDIPRNKWNAEILRQIGIASRIWDKANQEVIGEVMSWIGVHCIQSKRATEGRDYWLYRTDKSPSWNYVLQRMMSISNFSNSDGLTFRSLDVFKATIGEASGFEDRGARSKIGWIIEKQPYGINMLAFSVMAGRATPARKLSDALNRLLTEESNRRVPYL